MLMWRIGCRQRSLSEFRRRSESRFVSSLLFHVPPFTIFYVFQLLKQVPASLGQEITSHKRQVLQIQTTLHNSYVILYHASITWTHICSNTSEARRHNALLHIQDGSELLRPLRRPFEQASPASLLPTPNSSPKSSPASALESLEPPTPSPFFPIDVAHLIDLSPTEARKLVTDYGLDLEKPPRAGGPDSAFHEKNSNLNRFLAHIGVRTTDLADRIPQLTSYFLRRLINYYTMRLHQRPRSSQGRLGSLAGAFHFCRL